MAKYPVSALKPQQTSQTCDSTHITVTALCIAAKQLVQIIGTCTSVCRESYHKISIISNHLRTSNVTYSSLNFMRILILRNAVQWCVKWINWSLTTCK